MKKKLLSLFSMTIPVILLHLLSCTYKPITQNPGDNTSPKSDREIQYAALNGNSGNSYIEEGELLIVERKERNGIMTHREEKIMADQYARYSGPQN